MVLKIRCPECDYTLRFAVDREGELVQCFNCKTEFTLSPDDDVETGSGGQTPQTVIDDTWHVRTVDGKEYGPVQKSELVAWIDEGRIDETVQIRRASDLWQSADQVFPERFGHSKTVAPPGQPSSGPTVDREIPFSTDATGDKDPLQRPQGENPFQRPGDDNPFQPPQQDDSVFAHRAVAAVGYLDRESALAQIWWPATSLLIFAILALVLQLVGFAVNLTFNQVAFVQPGNPLFLQTQATTIGFMVLSLIFSVGSWALIVFGAIKMRRLESYGFSIAACVLPMVPCVSSCCCMIGVPLGSWALMALSKPGVRQMFDQPAA